MRSPDVEAWFATYESPAKDIVVCVRDIVLDTDPRIDECIKWSYPTFLYLGPLATFFTRSTHHASLMFHRGASLTGDFPHLTGNARKARTLRFRSVTEAEESREEIVAIVEASLALNELLARTGPEAHA